MSRKIWKYDLGNKITCQHDIPKDAEIRHVDLDPEGRLCVWMEVDDEYSEMYRHTFGIFRTGHPIPDQWEYIGTLRVAQLMFHIHHFSNLEVVPEEEEKL